MEWDFSTVNLNYLLRARELARSHPAVATTVLGLPPALVSAIAALDAGQLTHLGQVKPPLLVARGDAWWWGRLVAALETGRADEIDAVLEHAQLLFGG